MWACKLAGSHAMGKGKVSVWDLSTRKLNKLVPSQNKAFHRARQCSGAAVEAAAWSGAVPAVVNWNVLEAELPHHTTLLWRRWYPVLIWIPDCFLNTVWSGCVGRNEPDCQDAGHTGAPAHCVCPSSPSAGQACRDTRASWPWTSALTQGKAVPGLFSSWGVGSGVFEKHGRGREGAQRRAAGKPSWPPCSPPPI